MSTSTTPRGHKRTRSDSSVEIIAVRSVSKKKKQQQQATPPPPEEKRLRVFRHAPPHKFDAIWERATTERFFVLKRQRFDDAESGCPEEDFELAGTTGNVYTIRIARQPVCNCPWALKGNQCKHTVYILHRVLKAPYHLTYQLALLSSELRHIYDKLPQPSADADDGKKRKAIEGECAICYMDLEQKDDQNIVWCRAACGQNLHKVCFDTWARTCTARDVTCPLCRSPWEAKQNTDAAAVVVDTDAAVEGEDGYLNVASQLGISQYRDTSWYPSSRWIDRMEARMENYNRRRRRYYY
ncbi:RING finger domain protein (Znf1), putative [Cordyceps militaris CM01]|uniref:RING finger domain protein (Znf1), putative n=1 Tax=Cordyceps militaris (strain CM01) TaxID=983644 RepID=G3JQB9_CORMM|nr:RING finger domain protein (Znf1), putative [Cordyceps militaris CM01]EGX89370.1 RING finger domain protein (Znf1), putative [Cordyceps militaris CM01]